MSPDGTTLIVGEGESGTALSTCPASSRRPFSSCSPGWLVDYRPDAQQVLLAGRGTSGLGEDGPVLSAAVADSQLADRRNLTGTGITEVTWLNALDAAYSQDGRFIAVSADGTTGGGGLLDAAVVVWSAHDTDHPILRVLSMHAFGVVLSPDGGVLYVGTLDPALVAIDVATGLVLTSVPLSPLLRILPVGPDDDTWWTAMWDDLEISPDGRTLAVAERDDVLLLDAATLTQRTVLRGHADLVRSLGSSSTTARSSRSGSQDGSVVVWDVATGADVHRLVGHAGTVTGIAFSPDDHTAYTGGRDKRVLVWDLSGGKQLVAGVVPGGPRTTVAKQALPSPDGHAVVYSGSTVAVRDQLRFLDVASGRLGDAAPDAGGSEVSAWLPPDFHRVVTAAGPALGSAGPGQRRGRRRAGRGGRRRHRRRRDARRGRDPDR